MRPDKAKVVDEVWDDERIAWFLDKGPLGDEQAEFSILLYAYRSMRDADFARFIDVFKSNGGNVAATNNKGQTLAEIVRHHAKSANFLALLEQ